MCECVGWHMVTTGLEASLSHQSSTHRKLEGGKGEVWGVGPARCGGPFFPPKPRVEEVSKGKEMKQMDRCQCVCVCEKLTDASGAIGAGDEASWTGAHVAAGRVGALPAVAHARDGAALVDIWSENKHGMK